MRTRVLACAVVLACGVLSGCDYTAKATNSDFCHQWDDVVASAEKLLALDPETDSVQDLRQRADDFGVQLDQFQAVSENRMDSMVVSLRTAVDDLVVSAVDTDSGAIDATRPALKDARKQIKKAWSVVELMAVDQCGKA